MAAIVWEERFSVNVKIIDEQHKQLLAMINDLQSAMLQRRAAEKLQAIVDEMTKYARSHLAMEEGYMKKFGYPAEDDHKKAHDTFVETAVDLQKRLKSGALVLSMEVIRYLRDWLTDHILGDDQKLGPFLNSKGLH